MGKLAFLRPSCKQFQIILLDRIASDPPLNRQAFPDLRQSAAASAVTFGLDSYIIPTTPKGTLILLTSIPEGVGSKSVISPTGSGNSETTCNPEIIELILLSFSSNLSMRADPIDFCLAESKSFLFVLNISSLSDSICSEMQLSASFFCSKEAWAKIKEASFASDPNRFI